MSKKDTIRDIEDRLREDRANLSRTLSDLAAQVAPEVLADQVASLTRDYAAPAARRAGQVARENPLAVALAGAGLAWLIYGAARKRSEAAQDTPVAPPELPVDFEDGISEEWVEEIDALRQAASDRLEAFEREAANGASNSRDYARERARMVSDFAADLRASLQSGLSGLSEEARARIISARERAYAARLNVQERARETGSKASELAQDHPLVTAALGIAIGAALLSALPRRDTADTSELDQEESRLRRSAKDLWNEEKSRARKMAGQMGDEMRHTARDLQDHARSAGHDLSERLAEQLALQARQAVRDVSARILNGDGRTKH